MSQPTSILVFLPNWVGDVVMATPVLRALREAFPKARIAHFGRDAALAVLDGCAWRDETISDRTKSSPRAGNFLRAVRQVRRLRPEVAVLLPNSFRIALTAYLGRCKRRIGYARDGRGWMLTDRLAPPRDEGGAMRPAPMIDYYLELLRPLNVAGASRMMELPLTDDDVSAADRLLAEAGAEAGRPLVALNPGASFGTSKNWPAERYADLADRLIERFDAQILVNAAPNAAEKALAGEVVGRMRHRPLVNFADRDNTLGLLKGLLSRCDLLITNDTGARHVAAALGAGVVTIFGSTDPAWTRIDYPRERIVRVNVPCSPCQRKTCPLPPGPTQHRCMTAVTVENVFDAAAELLAAQKEPAE